VLFLALFFNRIDLTTAAALRAWSRVTLPVLKGVAIRRWPIRDLDEGSQMAQEKIILSALELTPIRREYNPSEDSIESGGVACPS
jgi:hypothetical protein